MHVALSRCINIVLVFMHGFSTVLYINFFSCSTNAQQWLDLIAVHHLKKLVYIDHGVGHQYLRVEFLSESACYTFLIRNDKKCTLCATMLARELIRLGVSPFLTKSVFLSLSIV